jgi:hypothetical protein
VDLFGLGKKNIIRKSMKKRKSRMRVDRIWKKGKIHETFFSEIFKKRNFLQKKTKN